MRRIALTRDSVCMADDIDAPHDGAVEVADDASLLDLAHAILRAPGWLAGVMGGATWYIVQDGAAVVFAERLVGSRVVSLGDADRPHGALDHIHVYYAQQEPPRDVAEKIRPSLSPSGRGKGPARTASGKGEGE